MRMRTVPGLLIGLSLIANFPAYADTTDSCSTSMDEVTISSPVTFAEFCNSFSAASFFSLNNIGITSTATLEVFFSIDSATRDAPSQNPATLYFARGAGSGLNVNLQTNPGVDRIVLSDCTLTVPAGAVFTPPYQGHSVGPVDDTCTVSGTDLAFLQSVSGGQHLFLAASGMNGTDLFHFSHAQLVLNVADAAVPEPATLGGVLTGLAVLLTLRRRARIY
jgi:hypothetical protein